MPNFETEPEFFTYDPDIRRIQSLVINSFRFSRGLANLQYSIVQFLGSRLKGQFEEDSFDKALEPTTQAAHRIRMNPRLHIQTSGGALRKEEETTREEVETFLDRLKNSSLGERNAPPIDRLASLLLSADTEWLPQRRENHINGQSFRAYSSNIVTHGFLQRSTGIPEYDEMYGLVAERLPMLVAFPTKDVFQSHPQRDLKEVVDTHIETWPEDRQFVEGFVQFRVLSIYT